MDNNWQEINLNKVCNIYQPKTITSKDISTSGLYKVFGANGVIGYFDKYNHEEPEVLMTCRGATCGTINLSEAKSWITGNAMVIQPRNVNYLNKMYLYYFLQYINPQSLISGSAQPQITRQAFINIKIPIPIFGVQQKIALILSTVDEEIKKNDQIIKKIEKIKSGLMNELLTKGIDHTKFKKTKVGEIPEDWELIKLGEYCSHVGSGSTPRGGSETYLKEGVPLIRSQNVHFGKLLLNDVAFISQETNNKMKRSIVKNGDVLLNITGASIGRVCVANVQEANVNQHVCIIRTQEKVESKYLAHFLESNYGQKMIMSIQIGGNRQGLNFQQIKKFLIPLPPINEQLKISNILDSVDCKITNHQKIKDNLSSIKNGLMNDIFNQKVEVKN